MGDTAWQRMTDGGWDLVGDRPRVRDSDLWQTPAVLVDMMVRTFIGEEGYLDPCGGHGSPMTDRAAVSFVPRRRRPMKAELSGS